MIAHETFFVGHSKAPESSARPICQSHTMTTMGHEPATICIAAYKCSPCYTLRHGKRGHSYEKLMIMLFV